MSVKEKTQKKILILKTYNAMKKTILTAMAAVALLFGGYAAAFADEPCTTSQCQAKEGFSKIGEGISEAATGSYNTVKEGTVNAYDKTAEGVENAYDKTADGTVKVYNKAAEGVENAYDKTAEGTVNVYNKTAEGTVNVYNKAKEGTVNLFEKTKEAIHKATE